MHNHRSFASVKIENIQAAGSLPATARITFDTINGVAPDLTNFSSRGQVLQWLDHPNAVLNGFILLLLLRGLLHILMLILVMILEDKPMILLLVSIFIGTDAHI